MKSNVRYIVIEHRHCIDLRLNVTLSYDAHNSKKYRTHKSAKKYADECVYDTEIRKIVINLG